MERSEVPYMKMFEDEDERKEKKKKKRKWKKNEELLDQGLRWVGV